MSREAVVVTGVIGADAHVTGNWVINHALKAAGIKVVGLGVCVPQQEFIDAAVESGAQAVWVTSMYGHARLDCEGMRERCVEAGMADILLYIGGMLVVGRQEWGPVQQTFRELGFDRAYPPNTLPEVAIKDLFSDLERRVRALYGQESVTASRRKMVSSVRCVRSRALIRQSESVLTGHRELPSRDVNEAQGNAFSCVGRLCISGSQIYLDSGVTSCLWHVRGLDGGVDTDDSTRAHRRGFPDLGLKLARRRVVQQDDHSVVALPEDLGTCQRACSARAAPVVIYRHLDHR